MPEGGGSIEANQTLQSNQSIELINWLNSINPVNRRAIEVEKNGNSIELERFSINFD